MKNNAQLTRNIEHKKHEGCASVKKAIGRRLSRLMGLHIQVGALRKQTLNETLTT